MVNKPAVGAKKKHSEVMQMLFAYNRLIHFNKFENPFGLQLVCNRQTHSMHHIGAHNKRLHTQSKRG
jgi:hypothetical protein